MNKATTALAALAALLVMAPSAAGAAPGLFGTTEFQTRSLAALPKWQRVLSRIEEEKPTYDACARSSAACPSRSVMAWQALIDSQKDRPPIDQLRAVNRFLNQWNYRMDEQNFGRRDYWATPLEFLQSSGDCEDYAIVKYVTLRRLGFAREQLRLVVVRDVVRDLAHAVLAVYLDDQVYILDNLTSSILLQEQVAHYVPYYSVNETTRWAHVPPADTMLSQRSQPMTPSAEAD